MKRILIFISIIGLFSCSLTQKQEDTVISSSQDTIFNAQDSCIYQAKNIVLMDTTMYSFGDIDNDSITDTISTNVIVKIDTVYIYYKWQKNNNLIWSYKFLSFTEFLNHYHYSIADFTPELMAISDFNLNSHLDWVVDFGLEYLNNKGYNVDKSEYQQYILDYNGELIAWGEPETREGLFFWYEPLKIFVLFYHP